MDLYPHSTHIEVVVAQNIIFEYRFPRHARCRIKSLGCQCTTWCYMCSTSSWRARHTKYSNLQYMHKPLHKVVIQKACILPTNPYHQLTSSLHRDPSFHIYKFLWDMRFSQYWRWRILSYGMWRSTYVPNFQNNVKPPSSVYLKPIMTATFSRRICSYTEIFKKLLKFIVNLSDFFYCSSYRLH
jgi:hypothetical protein